MTFASSLLLLTFALLVLEGRQTGAMNFSPSRMYLFGWLVTSGALASTMVVYRTEFAASTFALIGAVHLAFLYGAGLGARKALAQAARRPDPSPLTASLQLVVLRFMGALALIAVLLEVRDLLTGPGRLLLTNFAGALQEIRAEKWSDVYAGEVSVSPVKSLTQACALLIALLGPLFLSLRRPGWLLLSVLAAVAIALGSLLKGGRFSLGALAIGLVVVSSMSGRAAHSTRLITLPRLLLATSIAIYFFVIFPVQRNPGLATAVETHLRWSADALLSDWVRGLSARYNMPWLEVFAYATSYFSKSIEKLNFFLIHTDVPNWYRLGIYNVPQISQVLGIFSSGPTPWLSVRLEIADVMSQQGLALNPWATGVRDLVIDFGPIGAIPVAGLLGYWSQRVYVQALSGGGVLVLLAAALCSVGAFVFAFVSPLQIRLLSNGLWMLGGLSIVLWLVERSVRRYRRSRSQPRAPLLPI